MIDTILLDLDGTLLGFSQDEFVNVYFSKLKRVFLRLELDADLAIKALWAGTKAMILNDGSKLNSERFWETFAGLMSISGERLKEVERSCDNFYATEFDAVKTILKPNDLPQRLVRGLTARGFNLVLATNPLFPAVGVETRLSWAGLDPKHFCLITNYSNSSYCKPNLNYYLEIFKKLGKEPGQCLMAGNNIKEDMCAGELGAETFLVIDCLENEDAADISKFRHGTLAELETFLMAM